MSDADVYDKLAKVLKDVHQRFPEDGFTKHQRLRGLLADHLPDAEREIRVALDAIDEGVIGVLIDSPAGELGMQTDRLVTRLDTSRGIREDLARQVVQAFAYSLDRGGLPSTITSQPVITPPTPQPGGGGDDWVGVSEVVDQEQSQNQNQNTKNTPPPVPPPGAGDGKTDDNSGGADASLLTKLTTGNNRYIALAVVVVAALLLFQQGGNNTPQNGPQPAPGPQPNPQPSPQPGPQPGPQPAPNPQPTPDPQPAPQPQPGNNQSWYDPYGNVWMLQFRGNEFQGNNANTTSPVGGMAGMVDFQSGAVVYQIYDRSGQYIADGQGQFTDQTHINFMTIDTAGNVVGQGVLHVNHAPQ